MGLPRMMPSIELPSERPLPGAARSLARFSGGNLPRALHDLSLLKWRGPSLVGARYRSRGTRSQIHGNSGSMEFPETVPTVICSWLMAFQRLTKTAMGGPYPRILRSDNTN